MNRFPLFELWGSVVEYAFNKKYLKIYSTKKSPFHLLLKSLSKA